MQQCFRGLPAGIVEKYICGGKATSFASHSTLGVGHLLLWGWDRLVIGSAVPAEQRSALSMPNGLRSCSSASPVNSCSNHCIACRAFGHSCSAPSASSALSVPCSREHAASTCQNSRGSRFQFPAPFRQDRTLLLARTTWQCPPHHLDPPPPRTNQKTHHYRMAVFRCWAEWGCSHVACACRNEGRPNFCFFFYFQNKKESGYFGILALSLDAAGTRLCPTLFWFFDFCASGTKLSSQAFVSSHDPTRRVSGEP